LPWRSGAGRPARRIPSRALRGGYRAHPANICGPPQLSIDPNGNLASKTEGNDTWTYEWDAENQLKRVLKNSVEQARFAYDPLGRRVEKVFGASTTTYTYGFQDILREISGATTLKYIQGPDTDEPLAQDDGSGALTHLHADGLGSIVKATDSVGGVLATRRYDAFGNPEVGGTNGYAFTGREWDSETGLAYYRARYLDPKVGRFISEDPLRWLTGPNMYAYVSNHPTSSTDPFGLQEIDPNFSAGQAQRIADAISALSHKLQERPCCSSPERDPMELFGLLRLVHVKYDPELKLPNPALGGQLATPRGAVVGTDDYFRYRIRLTDRAFLKDCSLEHVVLHEIVHLTAKTYVDHQRGGAGHATAEAEAEAVAERCYPCRLN